MIMRKLIVHMQTTLDGRVSRPDGFFWEPFPWGDEETSYVNQSFAAADTWVMSRKLYEFVVPYWEQVAAGTAPDIGIPDSPARTEFAHILTSLTKVVFSHTLTDDPTTRRVVRSGDLVAHLRELKAQDGRDLIASFGPATLGSLVSTPGLIDEYLIVIHPAVLTGGPRMFEHATRDLGFTLQAARVFDGGAAVMRYRTLEPA
jgi:dihydrofolate reductase